MHVFFCCCWVTKLRLTLLWHHGLYSLPGSSVHRISQARILEWADISFSGGSSQSRIKSVSPGIIGRWILYHWATWSHVHISWGQKEKGAAEDEMVGWHHWLNGHEFEQTPGDSGQGSLVCCSSRGLKELDTTERLNKKNNKILSSSVR